MNTEKLEKLISLAAKTGILYVAPDVWTELQTHQTDIQAALQTAGLTGIKIIESPYLSKGSICAVDNFDWNGLLDEPFLSLYDNKDTLGCRRNELGDLCYGQEKQKDLQES